ncbi:uncharacterized mitochondrial protein AtMg00810-like [Hevea brasiliensis]|uniref:uncharacterized mitochondrial protein AtMg00810-like n=1 Tax=Hevea brasiliensis TaxID=3981 RepID=UPI0025FD5BBF|nr:uncharacterized mitochondrial protein AtMg00810-like [Hevea brasiliensis]
MIVRSKQCRLRSLLLSRITLGKVTNLPSGKNPIGCLEISRSKAGIVLNQRKYALDILSDVGFVASNPANTPMDYKLKLSTAETPLIDALQYRKLVGRLLYLTSTRPDIAFVVQRLSQFMDKPYSTHLQAAHRVLWHIKASPGAGILFPTQSEFQLKAFSDSDWVGWVNARKSITSFCVFFGSALICWRA